jgi:hypothetical protein
MLLFILLLLNPTLNNWFFRIVLTLADAVGLPLELYRYGWSLFQFWS